MRPSWPHCESVRSFGSSWGAGLERRRDGRHDALHGANRKALTAILLAQGLRPTRSGGHIAVCDAVHAQLEPPLGRDLATYHRVRRARNAGDYREGHDAVADDILADHPGCQQIVDIAKRVIGQMPRF